MNKIIIKNIEQIYNAGNRGDDLWFGSTYSLMDNTNYYILLNHKSNTFDTYGSLEDAIKDIPEELVQELVDWYNEN
tara:strand:- start:608 stop:835 length:228 start_codon:yes stop_codon:yes gene_type:complete